MWYVRWPSCVLGVVWYVTTGAVPDAGDVRSTQSKKVQVSLFGNCLSRAVMEGVGEGREDVSERGREGGSEEWRKGGINGGMEGWIEGTESGAGVGWSK